MTTTTVMTCGLLEEESSNEFLVMTNGCSYYQYYAHLCGCPDYRDEEPQCQLCQDGDDDSIESDRKINGHTCGEMAVEASFDPHRLGCDYYHYLGSLCGCRNNVPRDDGCQLCYDGETPPFAAQQVRLPGVETGTCEHVSKYSNYVHKAGSKECYSTQSTLGGFCGCDKLTQPVSRCPICRKEEWGISNDLAPTFKYLSPNNGKTTIHQSGMSCLEVEMMANSFVLDFSEDAQGTCSNIRKQVADVCCTANVLTSGSTTDKSAAHSMKASYSSFSVFSTTLLSIWLILSLV